MFKKSQYFIILLFITIFIYGDGSRIVVDKLSQLRDTDVSTIENGEGIVYNSSTEKYEPSTAPVVTSASNITDNKIVRGDGGAKGIQESDWTIDDSGNMLPDEVNTQEIGSESYPLRNIHMAEANGTLYSVEGLALTNKYLRNNSAVLAFTESNSVTDSTWTYTITEDNDQNYLVFVIGDEVLKSAGASLSIDITSYSGTDLNPKDIWIYVIDNSGTLELAASNTDPDGVVSNHVDIAVIKGGTVGVSSVTIYHEFSSNVSARDFIKNAFRRFFYQGSLYVSGLAITATQSNVTIGDGSIRTIFTTEDFSEKIVGTDGLTYIKNDLSFNTATNFAFPQYGDGGTIGLNKYYNVILGVAANCCDRIYAIVQDEPASEYVSINLAYNDAENKTNYTPNDSVLTELFIPVCRIIILNDANDYLQTIPGTSNYYIDVRGSNALSGGSSVSAGAPADADYWVGTANSDLTNEIVVNDEASLYSALSDVTEFLETNDTATLTDLTLSSPSNIYALSHDSFTDFSSDEHFTQANITTTGTVSTGVWGADFSADIIKDTDLDFGTGASQISASDMPDEDIGDIDIASGVYTIEPEFISGKADTTLASGDYLVFWDATDSTLKKVDADEVLSGGSGLYTIQLLPQQAKLTGSDITNNASIDAGDRGWRLLFDDSTEEEAVWQFVVDPNYAAGTASLEILFSMTSVQSGDTNVKWDAKIMAVTGSSDSTDFNSDSYASEQTVTHALATDQPAGYVRKATITFTQAQADAMAVDDIVRIHIARDVSVASNASGDAEILGTCLHE